LLNEAWERRQGKEARLLGIFIGFAEENEKSKQLSLDLELSANIQDIK